VYWFPVGEEKLFFPVTIRDIENSLVYNKKMKIKI